MTIPRLKTVQARLIRVLLTLFIFWSGCRNSDLDGLHVSSVDPGIVDPIGGSCLIVRGRDFTGVTALFIGEVPVISFEVVSDSEIRLVSAPIAPAEDLDLTVVRVEERAVLQGALAAWSPADLPGARLFDAASGVQTGDATTTYEWQRLTAEISPDWRVRDGNTLTWLPSTGRFWMVAGWNGLREPDGFSTVDPDTTYPPENTTDEVWSSADGVTWTLELAHGNGAFERRHAHNTVLWNDRLWMVGGDTHQGYYNHDVVSSADGRTWDVVLGPGTTRPPWSERALQTIGVYDGRLWMAGGQDLLGDPAAYAHHNDVWVTEDGENWTEVVGDAPASDTRWAGCGMVDGLVEFRGEMWLVGCARYDEISGHMLSNEVWSTTDGVTWHRHAEPPWKGKGWPNVVVWDEKLWILFGYTYGDPANGWTAGNANEVWYSADGETWSSLPVDSPVPGSHAQGVAVHDEYLLFAGGNYSFYTLEIFDKSAWRLVPFRGETVLSWTERGTGALSVRAATPQAQPVFVAEAFGPGIPGLQFDGSKDVLDLDAELPDTHANGRSVFWVARAPYLPAPWGWEEVGAPLGTVLGGPARADGLPVNSVGLSDGRIVVHAMNTAPGPSGETVWTRFFAGEGLQEGVGEARLAGVTQSATGVIEAWIDGVRQSPAGVLTDAMPPAWSQIGGSMTDGYYGPNTRFAGTLGAVIILPGAADAGTVTRIHAWARGRFRLP